LARGFESLPLRQTFRFLRLGTVTPVICYHLDTLPLGGNAFSGATDLIQSIGSGEAGGHSAFYNMGQGVVAGPTQGFGSVFGNRIKGTPWGSGPADVATVAILNNAQNIVTGSGQTIQTLNDAVELGTVLGEAGEWASGIGEAKLAYDYSVFCWRTGRLRHGNNTLDIGA
jgi:hypothetical protein